MFEYLAILTLSQMLSKYCHSKKILLRFYYDIRSGIVIKGGHIRMDENEIRLFNIINENDNPELAVLTAIKVFAAFLEQPEATPAPLVACPLESA